MVKHGRPAAMGFIFTTLLIDTMGFGLVIPIFPKLLQQLGHFDLSKAAQCRRLYGHGLCRHAIYIRPGPGEPERSLRPSAHLVVFPPGLWPRLCVPGPGAHDRLVVCRSSRSLGSPGRVLPPHPPISPTLVHPEQGPKLWLIGVAFGLGFIFGPLLGGILGGIGLRLPFFVAGGFSLLNMIFGYFVSTGIPPGWKRTAI